MKRPTFMPDSFILAMIARHYSRVNDAQEAVGASAAATGRGS